MHNSLSFLPGKLLRLPRALVPPAHPITPMVKGTGVTNLIIIISPYSEDWISQNKLKKEKEKGNPSFFIHMFELRTLVWDSAEVKIKPLLSLLGLLQLR